MTRVGWIGLGAMGAPMAACVARAGHQVLAYDIDPGRAQALAADGVKAASTVSQAAHGAEVLAVMVATPAQVEAVLYGDDPAAAALPPGSVVLVMATVGPAAVQDWATRLATQGLHLVDAPVSGGVARATTGDLLIMVAAPEAALSKVRPVLEAMARTAPVVGSVPGDGQKVKLVNQLLCGVHIAVAAEALAFAEAMGLDAEATWEVIRHGAAASFMLDDRGRRMVHGSFEQVNSALDIFVKDMGLVIDAARQHDYPAPLAGATEQLYLAGRRAGRPWRLALRTSYCALGLGQVRDWSRPREMLVSNRFSIIANYHSSSTRRPAAHKQRTMTCDNVIPIRPDVELEQPTQAYIKLLQPAVEQFTGLLASLARITPEPSLSAGTWSAVSLPLRTQLPAAERALDQLAEVDAADWPDTRWALDVGAARCQADQRLRQVRAALGVLLEDGTPSAERIRQLRRFARGRAELRVALERLCALFDSGLPDRSCG